MHDRSSWPRRLIMPVAILAVAAVLMWRSAGIDADQHNAVRVLVAGVCEEVLQGRDPAPRLAASDPLLVETLVQRLREVLDPDAKLLIEVTEGDTPEAGDFAGSATHVAVIRLDGARVISLRAAHGSDPADVAIIGFF